jgi:flagellar biosynthesis protein FlhA
MRSFKSLIPLVFIGAVLMMVVPIPPVLLDVLLAVNITIAVLVLLAVLYLKDTLDFAVFPSVLLMATLLRLALNVSSTRLILSEGYAGKVIETFGGFVIGGSVVVGLVVFLILVVIQFVVITNGAGRVAEVAARFTLDAMPGKQMAIDADLASGLIDEGEARERRKRIASEADFYGAMDGSSKFVKGDAIAGIVVVMINMTGGFAIGVAGQGMTMAEAASTYSLLTVGDGLVSQIPALLISLATGLLVTRVGDGEEIAPLIGAQLFGNPQALRVGALAVGGLLFLPGLPKLPFLLIGLTLLVLSGRAKKEAQAAEASTAEATPAIAAHPDDPEVLVEQMRVEPLELHLAVDTLDLIDPARGGDLLERVRALRQQIAMELGVVMPLVRTRDDISLPPSTYRVLLHGVEVARGTAPQDRVLALPAGDGSELAGLGGTETVEPVFNLPAYWIPLPGRAAAAATGATVVDRSAVIVTHIAEIARSNAAELLTRQQVQLLVEGLRYDEPLLAGEVGSEVLPISLLGSVLRGLLAERVPIRDLVRIVEAVSVRARETRSVEQLVSAARTALGPAIVDRIAPDRRLAVVTLDPAYEGVLHECLRDVDGALHLAIDADRMAVLADGAQRSLASDQREGRPLAIVTGQMLRAPLQRCLQGMGLELPVLAYPELPQSIELLPIGVIGNVRISS